ncbi:MAG: hypothetical protein L0I24_06850 [Pseudonocardia sp.]|nr:hypothetical protein [Pseudonocardia sp.]
MTTPRTEPAPTPERLAVLAHTANVAAFGPDGVFDPSWLTATAVELIEYAHALLGMAARAELAQTATVDELVGVGR